MFTAFWYLRSFFFREGAAAKHVARRINKLLRPDEFAVPEMTVVVPSTVVTIVVEYV